jgi:hypothetical protein
MTPVIIVASEQLQKEIDEIVLLLGETVNEKILKLVPEILKRCNLQNESRFDEEFLASVVQELVQKQDFDFMSKFAYT